MKYEPDTFPVYNVSSGELTKITIKQLLDIGISGICSQIPMGKMMLLPSGGVTTCKFYNLIRTFFLQIIPAMLTDIGLKYKGETFRLMKVQRRMFEANKALSYFVTNMWIFQNTKAIELSFDVKNEDLRSFAFDEMYLTDMTYMVRNALLGYRRFLMNDKDEDLEKDRKKYKKLERIGQVSRIIIAMIVLLFLYQKFFTIFKLIRNWRLSELVKKYSILIDLVWIFSGVLVKYFKFSSISFVLNIRCSFVFWELLN